MLRGVRLRRLRLLPWLALLRMLLRSLRSWLGGRLLWRGDRSLEVLLRYGLAGLVVVVPVSNLDLLGGGARVASPGILALVGG